MELLLVFLFLFSLHGQFLSTDLHRGHVWITQAGRCVAVCLWRTNEIGHVKGTGSWLWSLWKINVPGELSALTGGAVDVLSQVAVPQWKGMKSKGITPTAMLPITANYLVRDSIRWMSNCFPERCGRIQLQTTHSNKILFISARRVDRNKADLDGTPYM